MVRRLKTDAQGSLIQCWQISLQWHARYNSIKYIVPSRVFFTNRKVLYLTLLRIFCPATFQTEWAAPYLNTTFSIGTRYDKKERMSLFPYEKATFFDTCT